MSIQLVPRHEIRQNAGKKAQAFTTSLPAMTFPFGFPMPLHSEDMELPNSIFERYFGMSAKRLEEIYLDGIPDFKALLKTLRKHGNDTPQQRMTMALATSEMRRSMMLNHSMNGIKVPSLELVLIRRYMPSIEQQSFDRFRLRGFKWFAECDPRVSTRNLPDVRHYLMALLPAMEELAQWAQLSPQRQEDLAMAIFALGSMLDTRTVIDVAINICPEIQKYYDTLAWDEKALSGQSLYQVPAQVLPYLGNTPDEIIGILNCVSYFVNDFLDEHKPTVANTIRRIENLYAYVKSHEDPLLAEHRVLTKEIIDKAITQVQTELASFSELEGFSAAEATQKYLCTLRDLVEKADLEGLGQVDNAVVEFIRLYDNTVKKAWESHDHVKNAEDRLFSLIKGGAMKNAAKISEISGRLQSMRGVFDNLFKPLTELRPPTIQVMPVPTAVAPVSPEVSNTDKLLMDELIAKNEALENDNLLLKQELSNKAADAYRAQNRGTNHVSKESSQDLPRNVADTAMATGHFTPKGVLYLIAAVYGADRVLVLPSAYESAVQSDDFKHSRRLYDLITLLVTDYRDTLKRGRPDAEARHILGNAYRANESETVQENRNLARRRVFMYEGNEIPMYQHIGIGVDASSALTIRVHFHWDAERGRIVIGYCGPHLETLATA